MAAGHRAILCLYLLVFMADLAIGQPVRASDLPDQAQVSGVIGHAQRYNLSCESRSAADWAAYFGVSTSEDEILALLQRTDNPDTGFVGSPGGVWGNIPPQSYGVHAAPIAAALRKAGVTQARTRVGFSWNAARAEIAADRPIIVWIIGSMWTVNPERYTASNGKTTTVARFEHTMILVGYSPTTVNVIDAYSGWNLTYSLDGFLASWSVLGNMAVVWKPDEPPPPTPTPTEDPGLHTVRAGETLLKLARHYDLTWQELAQANQLAYPYFIYPGQVLHLPQSQSAPTPTANPPMATPTQPSPAPTESPPDTYTVRKGEYLIQLAGRFGLDWRKLVEINSIPYPYTIYPGQVLRLQ
ncbi:MAG TPA: LysM peptidoglycan-binding domain-containing protein [Anaerolineaceae bacterium]|nr:LysM peptidoglycan-binding domain-containing protein [Anaerolineaceae bacterium]